MIGTAAIANPRSLARTPGAGTVRIPSSLTTTESFEACVSGTRRRSTRSCSIVEVREPNMLTMSEPTVPAGGIVDCESNLTGPIADLAVRDERDLGIEGHDRQANGHDQQDVLVCLKAGSAAQQDRAPAGERHGEKCGKGVARRGDRCRPGQPGDDDRGVRGAPRRDERIGG
jgi:hypothetical protein